jgi:hypothetical protein
MKPIIENVNGSRNNHCFLIPNINKSDRDLPASISGSDIGNGNILDKERKVKKLSDKELYSLIILVAEEELNSHKELRLQLIFDPQIYLILNKSGIRYNFSNKDKYVIDLKQEHKDNTKTRGIQFYIEVQTFVGSPLLTKDVKHGINFKFSNEKDEVLAEYTRVAQGDIRPSDIILLGDNALAERIFMCELTENLPSVFGVKDAASKAGVPLTIVPSGVGLGDTWLQDQFQIGYTGSSNALMQVIVHLPRMVNDSALIPNTPNLRNFVDNYFPSKKIGVFKDFWKLRLQITDGQNSKEVTVEGSYILLKELLYTRKIYQFILLQLERINPNEKTNHANTDQNDLFSIAVNIEASFMRLNGYTNLSAEQRNTITYLKNVIDKQAAWLSYRAGKVELSIPSEKGLEKFVFTIQNKDLLNDFFLDLLSIHSSGNYGGNIEVSPSMSGAPYGKIISGSVYLEGLKAFLTSRGNLHPLASAYTGWLTVGHIDEIMSFVKDPSSPEGFSVCAASPRLAVSLLEKLVEAQQTGKLVTRLFRGKKWIHQALPGSGDKHLPPNYYINFTSAKNYKYDLTGFARKFEASPDDKYFDSAYHDDRKFIVFNKMGKVDTSYAAFITCDDVLSQTKVTNRIIDDFFLTGAYHFADDVSQAHYYNSDHYQKVGVPGILDKVLKKNFQGIPVYKLPVLFDWMDNFSHSSAAAIVPDLINFQALNDHLLIPKPYAPRMKTVEAIEFMKKFLQRVGDGKIESFASSNLNKDYITGNNLNKTYHWTRATEKVSIASIGKLPTEFDPDFEEMWLSIYQSIYSSNAYYDAPSLFEIQHAKDPYTNHPVTAYENLFYIANYFKDGFDEFKNIPVDYCKGDDQKFHPKQDAYDESIQEVMDKIKKANRDAFDDNGNILSKEWIKIEIPEDTVDMFELYTQLLMDALGLQVHWIDSWYYHTHGGGIHCGTNVLRVLGAR